MAEFVDTLGFDDNQRLRIELINSANEDSNEIFKLDTKIRKVESRRRTICWAMLYGWMLIVGVGTLPTFLIMLALGISYLINRTKLVKLRDERDIMVMVLRFTKYCEKQIRIGEI